MTGMTLELTTSQLQLLVLAVILRDKHNEPEEWAEEYAELEAVLSEMNTMCRPENNYTLTVEITA